MECAICLQEIDFPKKVSCCKNSFCSDCLQKWLRIRNSCPLCAAVQGGESFNNLQKLMTDEFDPEWMEL